MTIDASCEALSVLLLAARLAPARAAPRLRPAVMGCRGPWPCGSLAPRPCVAPNMATSGSRVGLVSSIP